MRLNRCLHKVVSGFQNLKFQNKSMAGYLLACILPLVGVSVIIHQQSAAGLKESSQEFASLYTSQIRTLPRY